MRAAIGDSAIIILTAGLILLMSAGSVSAQDIIWNESAKEKAERMAWWSEARFGMFIHWGLYAAAARHEWVQNRERIPGEEYRKYFQAFNPDLFDPEEWAGAAREAGMKYFVVTAKHHEGFCLWDSRLTEFKATNTSYGKDLLHPLIQAFRAEGLKVGLYYSLIDWHHPEFPVDRYHPMRDDQEFREREKDRDVRIYADYCRGQMRELLTGFGAIDCLFLDFSYPGEDGKGRREWQSIELLKMIRSLQPKIIVNDRADLLDIPGGWDFRTPEQFMPRSGVTISGEPVAWETCQTFSGSWGYHRDEASWKSVRQLIVMLIETVSKGGNLLLNVGPTARGALDERSMARLKGIGRWMKYHDRSITACTQAPEEFPIPRNSLLTYNPKTRRIYVHVLDWPIRHLHLDGFAGRVKYAQLLNDGSEILFSQRKGAWMADEQGFEKDTLTLELPVGRPNVTVPVIELFLK